MPPVAHALLGASSADRWLHCPPSAKLNDSLKRQFGDQSSEAAELGTRAHALGELKIRHGLWDLDGMTMIRLANMPAAERPLYQGVNAYRFQVEREKMGDFDEDIEGATDLYAEIVLNKLSTARVKDPDAFLLLEQHLDYSKWVPHGFGTSDATIVADGVLQVCDYKNGLTPVDAVGNPQMRLYALGALSELAGLYDFQTVTCTIIQPRIGEGGITAETVSVDDLLAWADEVVVPAAKLAAAGAGDFQPGEWCKYCAAKPLCAARYAEGTKVFRYGLEGRGCLSDCQIGEIMPFISAAEDLIKGLKAYTLEQAIAGHQWRGHKLVRGKKGNTKWVSEKEAREILEKAGIPETQWEERKMLTPTKVKKAMGAKEFNALLDGMTSQAEGALTLVPDTDKRPAWDSAEADFGDLT